jgi:hypothetical protein
MYGVRIVNVKAPCFFDHDPEIEYTFHPSEHEALKAFTQQEPEPRKREATRGSRGAGKTPASKRIRKQVLLSKRKEAFDWEAYRKLRGTEDEY